MYMKSKKFTIIELLAVLAMIGIIAAIVIPNISNTQGQANIASFNSPLSNIERDTNLEIVWEEVIEWGSSEENKNYRLEVSYNEEEYQLLSNNGENNSYTLYTFFRESVIY